jgi:preprotein translocase SecF subunit
VFNLTGKRYLFLIISLIVIVPGTLSLIFKGLNVGIDFLGGANIELRPEKALSITQVRDLVGPFKLLDLQVVTGADTQLPGNQTIWIRLNTRIDKTVQTTITGDLQAKYPINGNPSTPLSVSYDDLTLVPSGGGNARTVTVVTVSNFQKGVKPAISDIESVLSKLPDTSDPALGPSTSTPTPTTTATATATATGTPSATATANGSPTATATPKATNTPSTAAATPTPGKGTPSVLVTPTATPATGSNPSNIPVKVDDVHQGTTTQTITLLTRTTVGTPVLLAHFVNSGNYMQVLQNSTVSGSVASETTRNAILAVVAAAVLILLYISFAFRKVARPWRYGACAIIALLHDVLVVVGVFSILGWLFNLQIDALFITALLTVVGFSVHDTIVVFDRIRENMQRRTSETFDQVVNASLVQTMARSLNTSLTVLVTLSALTLFGGETIRVFTGALLLGIFSGTYSSIFNASMLLVIWERGELGLGRFSRGRTPDGREARELARSRG